MILGRDPWALEAARLLSSIDRGEAEGYIPGYAVTTVYYVVARQRDATVARTAVADLLDVLAVVPADEAVFCRALALPFADFEDAIQAGCAMRIAADCVVTRNEHDFERSPVRTASVGVILSRLADRVRDE